MISNNVAKPTQRKQREVVLSLAFKKACYAVSGIFNKNRLSKEEASNIVTELKLELAVIRTRDSLLYIFNEEDQYSLVIAKRAARILIGDEVRTKKEDAICYMATEAAIKNKSKLCPETRSALIASAALESIIDASNE